MIQTAATMMSTPVANLRVFGKNIITIAATAMSTKRHEEAGHAADAQQPHRHEQGQHVRTAPDARARTHTERLGRRLRGIGRLLVCTRRVRARWVRARRVGT